MKNARVCWDDVYELLSRHEEPTKEQAETIRPALVEIYRRWRIVHTLDPKINLGERTLRLMVLVGIHRSKIESGK